MTKPTWSRREFLEVSTAAAGASLAPKSLRAMRVPPSDTIRFGIVGVGMQGSGLLGTSISLSGVTCAGAADLYDGRHTLAKEIAGASLPTTRRYQQLLDDKNIDCIIAAVPDHWHKKIVVDAKAPLEAFLDAQETPCFRRSHMSGLSHRMPFTNRNGVNLQFV